MRRKRAAALVIAAGMVASGISVPVSAQGVNAMSDIERSYESMDRGLAVMLVDSGVYMSWRLDKSEDKYFGTASSNVSFNVYKNGAKIDEVIDTTNYTDASGTSADVYAVAPVTDGIEGEMSEGVSAYSSGSNYFDIPMKVPENVTLEDGATYSYSVGDCSTGDVDADGEYEIIVKWDCNPQDNSNGGITGNVLIDAYKQDGTFLWRVDLGRNIRSGAHYTQFLVYDYDGDGSAEMVCQTAPGSIDGAGAYVTEAASDEDIKSADNDTVYTDMTAYVDQNGTVSYSGRNLTGDEYLTIFDGETGAALDTIYYPAQRIAASVWGDTYGNRCDRFVGDVAYLDGENPYAVYVRGYYFRQSGGSGERMTVCAVRFDGEKLISEYCFDTYDADSYRGKSSSISYKSDGTYKGVNGYVSGYENYVGQGNHNMTAADVDGDGRDEVITGALCIEMDDSGNMVPKWCTDLGHGDAMHIGDYDPTHEGYEFFTVHEESPYGMSVIDAETGEVMFHEDGSSDTGRGMMANVGAGGYYQFWSARNDVYQSNGGTDFTSAGISKGSQNFRVFWDGDVYDELLDGTGITSWTGSGYSYLFYAEGCTSINGTKANPALQADLFGDWREEVCYPLEDNSAIRVYTTNISTDYKMASLMQDSVYRSGVAAEQSSYNQPPHIGYYVDEESFVEKTAAAFTVTDENGMPVYGASIVCGTKSGTTGIDGTIAMSIPNGDYTIEISCGGYDSTSIDTSLIGEDVSFNVVLAKTVSTEAPAAEESEIVIATGVGGFDVVRLTNGEVEFASDNTDVAIVDENGLVYAVSEGTANIYDASSEDGTDAVLCKVTVIGGGYDQTPSAVRIFGEDSIKSNRSEASQPAEYTAYVYDQYGVKLHGANISWNGGEAEGMSYSPEIEGGFDGELTITAEYDGIEASKTVAVEAPEAEVVSLTEDFSGSEFSGFRLTQQTSEAAATEQIGSIIFYAGVRDRGGDGVTGFSVDQTSDPAYLRAGAGQWSTANRNAYFTIVDDEGIMEESCYELTADIYFETSTYDMTISIGDGTNIATQLTAEGLGIENDAWYGLSLVYEDGMLTQTITNDSGAVVSEQTVGCKYATNVFSFTAEGGNAYARIANLSLSGATESSMSVNMRITDADGNAVEGAAVTAGSSSAVTDGNGCAIVEARAGAHRISVEKNGIKRIYAVEIGSETNIDIVFEKTTGQLLAMDGEYMYVYVDTSGAYENGVYWYNASYTSDKALDSVTADGIGIASGKSIVKVEANAEKTFVWDAYMMPIVDEGTIVYE